MPNGSTKGGKPVAARNGRRDQNKGYNVLMGKSAALYRQRILKGEDELFSTISNHVIDYMMAVYKSTPYVQSVVSYAIRQLVSSGIIIDYANSSLDKVHASQYKIAWDTWLEKMMFSLWIFGFAPCVKSDDPPLVGIPTVLPVDMLDIQVATDFSGRRYYRFYPRDTILTSSVGPGMGSMNGRSADRTATNMLFGQAQRDAENAVPNVLVFESEPPDKNGGLMSKMFSVLATIEVYHSAVRLTQVSFTRMANPPLVIEDASKDVKPGEISLNLRSTGTAELEQASVLTAMSLKMDSMSQQMEDVISSYNMGDRSGGTVPLALKNHELLELPAGRRLARPITSPVLPDIDEATRRMHGEVSARFGVPSVLIVSHANSLRSAEALTDAKRLFDDHMNNMKKKLLRYAKQMFAYIFDDPHLAWLSKDPTINTVDVLTANMEIKASIPSIPTVDRLMYLYRLGIYKGEAMIPSIAHMEGVPVEHLHKKPQLTPVDLMGIGTGDFDSSGSSDDMAKKVGEKRKAPSKESASSSSSKKPGDGKTSSSASSKKATQKDGAKKKEKDKAASHADKKQKKAEEKKSKTKSGEQKNKNTKK